MPLQTYEQVLAQADMIEEVVLDQRMPPWPGHSPRPVVDDVQLSPEQRSTLIAWIRGGRLEGDRAQGPPPVDWPQPGEWQIGKPDVVLRMEKPYRVPANGLVDYVYYPIRASFPEDRYIRAIETVPGNRAVVHHIQVHEYNRPILPGDHDTLSALEQLMLYGPTLDGAKLAREFHAGQQYQCEDYGNDAGMKLSRGANLIVELHYTPNGREAFDQSKIGIIFAKKARARDSDALLPPPTRRLRDTGKYSASHHAATLFLRDAGANPQRSSTHALAR